MNRLLICLLSGMGIFWPVMLPAQQDAALIYLTRYKKKSDISFTIPATKFCFVKNAVLVPEWPGGWVMKWDVKERTDSSLLFLEMNSSEVNGEWDDIAGSVQLVVKLPPFKDSIVLHKLTERSKAIQIINNYGGVGSRKKEYASGSLKIIKKDSLVYITSSLDLLTKRPDTKQQFEFANVPLKIMTCSDYLAFENKRDSIRETEKNEFVEAMVSAVKERDSVWDIEEAKQKDSLLKHPYTGPFRFWASKVDKVEYTRITYEFNGTSLIIKEGPYDFIYLSRNYSRDVVKFKSRLRKNERESLANLGKQLLQDTLQGSYSNPRVMDGFIVCFDLEWPGRQQYVTVSNFYDDDITVVINFINKVVPRKYRIVYKKEHFPVYAEKDNE